MSDKPRGNKTSKAARAKRQADALKLMKTGATQEAIADQLGISRTTFWRDLQAIEACYVEGSKDDVAAFKKNQYDALIRIESATAEGSIPPDVANALTRIRDSVARLLGLNAPTKSISANVNVDVDPLTMGMYDRFLHECGGLSPEQWDELWLYMRNLPRKPVDINPPIDAPTWHLTEGEADETDTH